MRTLWRSWKRTKSHGRQPGWNAIQAVHKSCPPTSTTHVRSTEQISPRALIVTNSCDDDLVLWHNRMGHVNIHTIKNMSAHNSVQDLLILPHSKLPHVCRGCALGKQHKSTYPSNPQKERSKVPGELLHADFAKKNRCNRLEIRNDTSETLEGIRQLK